MSHHQLLRAIHSFGRTVARAVLTTLIASLAALPAAGAQSGISINPGLTPSPLTFGLFGIAWQITPLTSTTIGGMKTWFSGVAGGVDRDVTFEIRDGANVNGPALRTVTFNSSVARTGLGGVTFSPIDLNAGSSYWLVFLNIKDLGRNVQESAPTGATLLSVRILPPGAPGFIPAGVAATAPVLELTPVPEPVPSAMLAFGLASGTLVARNRRRHRAGARRTA